MMRITLPSAAPGTPGGVGWLMPAEVIRKEQAQKLNKNESTDLLRSHHVAIDQAGDMCPVEITGYHADPGLPVRFMTEVSGGPLVCHGKLTGDDEFEVYSSFDDTAGHFNLWASLTVSDLADTALGFYGIVFIAAPPDADGVIRKLRRDIKIRAMSTLRMYGEIINGRKPAGISDEVYAQKQDIAYRVMMIRNVVDELGRAERIRTLLS